MALVAVGPLGIGKGMGAYPTLSTDVQSPTTGETLAAGSPNPCFDPNRPWYYPYWWDTAGEEACRHSYGIGPMGISTSLPIIGGISLPSFSTGGRIDANTGNVVYDGQVSGLDSTLSSLAGIIIVLGLASMILTLYTGRR